jgi:hypothetical protein
MSNLPSTFVIRASFVIQILTLVIHIVGLADSTHPTVRYSGNSIPRVSGAANSNTTPTRYNRLNSDTACG